MTDLALLNQSLERRHDLVEHALDRETAAPGGADDRVVELERSTRSSCSRVRLASSAAVIPAPICPGSVARQPHLGADIDLGLQRLEDAAEILFRAAVAVLRGGVEIIDAELQRAGDGALLVGRRAADHQPADRAAAEAQQRDVEPGLAEPAFFHHSLPRRVSPPDQIGSDVAACQSADSPG